jgi:hypothetical protein
MQRMSMPDGGLYRAWKDGAAKVPGFLDDYTLPHAACSPGTNDCLRQEAIGQAAGRLTAHLSQHVTDF